MDFMLFNFNKIDIASSLNNLLAIFEFHVAHISIRSLTKSLGRYYMKTSKALPHKDEEVH